MPQLRATASLLTLLALLPAIHEPTVLPVPPPPRQPRHRGPARHPNRSSIR